MPGYLIGVPGFAKRLCPGYGTKGTQEQECAMRIAVLGAAGRMGQMLIRAVDEAAPQGAVLAGVTERPGHDWVGS